MVDWDRRYREGVYDKATRPHELVTRFWPSIPRGVVIDIASGLGRDSLFLADKGLTAVGLEKSGEALTRAKDRMATGGKGAAFVQGDAEALPFKAHSASGVLVFYFLLRDRMGEIVDLLAKGGILMYETFLKRQNTIDPWRNPDYLLDDGELISYFSALDLLFYEETVTVSDGKRRAIAQYVGRKI